MPEVREQVKRSEAATTTTANTKKAPGLTFRRLFTKPASLRSPMPRAT